MGKYRVEKIIKKPIERDDYASEQGAANPKFSKIDCGLGHSPLGYPQAIDTALRAITPQILNEYPADPYAGNLAPNIQKRFDLSEESSIYFSGAGSYGLLASMLSDLLSQEAVKNGTEILGYGPQFTNIALLADRAQVPYSAVEPDLDAPITDKMQELINKLKKRMRKAHVVYVDNPNNPTGDVAPLETLVQLLKVSNGKDLIIIDEAYGDLVDDRNSAIPLTQHFPNLVVLRSISKGIGLASPRLGYAVMSQPVGEIYKNFELVFSVDAVTHLLGQVALNPNVLANFLPQVRQRTRQLKHQTVDVLQKYGIRVYPTHPDVSILMAEGPEHFYGKLLSVGITTEDGGTFKPTHKKMDDSFVRIRIPASEQEIVALDQRLSILKNQR